MWCVVVCDLETSRMGAPYVNDISSLRVKVELNTELSCVPLTNVNKTTEANFVTDKQKELLKIFQVFLSVQIPGEVNTQLDISSLFQPRKPL